MLAILVLVLEPSVPFGLWLPVIANGVCFVLARGVLSWSVSFRSR